VHVHVARVPARLVAHGTAVVAGRPVGLVRERRVLAQVDLHAPFDLAVGVSLRLRDHRRHTQLRRPAAGPDRPGDEAPRGLPRDLHPRARLVVGLGREALRGERHVGVARPAPAPELTLSPEAGPALARAVQAQVQGVPLGAPLGTVPAVLHPDGRGASWNVEGEQHVVLAQVRAELSGDDPVGRDSPSSAGSGQAGTGLGRERLRRRLGRCGRREHEQGEDQQGGGAAHGREPTGPRLALAPVAGLESVVAADSLQHA
jgi:hypothetical protein